MARLLAAFLLLASAVDAQTIAGVVRASDCSVLPGATVALRGDSTEQQAITDVHGAFAFNDLQQPRYSLRIRVIGFYTFSREDVLPFDEASRSLAITLPFGPLSEATRVQRVMGMSEPAYTDAGLIGIVDQDCRPVRGATIEIRAASVTKVRTDADGWTRIPAALNGDAAIRVTAPGLIPVSIPSVTVPFKFHVPLTVALRRGRSDIADILDSRLQMPSKILIVAMGDSTTAGTPAFESPRESPPKGRGDETSQYAYWLMKAHPDWQVVNQGINGQRSDQIRARFETDVVAKKPAVVVIIAGVNDVYQGRPVQHVKEELAAMFARAREAGIRVIAGTIIPYNVATPEQNLAMRDINEWMRVQAEADRRLLVVDTRAAVAAPGHPDRLAGSPDGLHPDPAGYRRMADAIAPAIEQALRDRR